MQAAGYPLIALAAQWGGMERRGHPRSISGPVLGTAEKTEPSEGSPLPCPMKQGKCETPIPLHSFRGRVKRREENGKGWDLLGECS